MVTKKQNKRSKVRHLRRVLNRTLEPIRGFAAGRFYKMGWGDGRMPLPRNLDGRRV